MALPKPQLNGDVLDYDEIQTDGINDLETTVTDHNSKIMQLLNWMGLVKDYVIDSGSNANGSWEKWASGKLIQKKVHAVFRPVATISTSIDYLWTFPIPFANPSEENDKLPIYGCSFECIQQGTSTRVGIIGTAFSKSLSAQSFTGWAKDDGAFNDYTFRLRAEGYWK